MKRSKRYSANSLRSGGHKAIDSLFAGDVIAARNAMYRPDGTKHTPSPRSVDFLSAVTVCVNYSDYFRHCVEQNHKYLDEWVVVTSPDDSDTIDLCKGYDNITLVKTDCFYRDGASFNKGCAVNMGLSHASKEGWIVILDADIVLCKNFREILNSCNLSIATLYGTPRLFAEEESQYIEYRDSESDSTRMFRKRQSFRRTPIGYFQLFHSINLNLPVFSVLHPYPDDHSDATHSDMVFMNKFKSKASLRGAPVIHLGQDGINWYGRISPSFNSNNRELNFPNADHGVYLDQVRVCLNSSTRDIGESFQKFLDCTNIYVSLTSSPLRIGAILNPLNTLDLGNVKKVLLSLPEKYRGEEEYDVPNLIKQDPRVKLIRDFEDMGPISKLLPALKFLKKHDPDSILITIDDDTLYPYGMVLEIAYDLYDKQRVVSTASAPGLDFWGIDHSKFPGPYCRVSEGFSGVGYRVSDISEKCIEDMETAARSCKTCLFSDDIVHSYFLSELGIDVSVISNMHYGVSHIKQLDYGFQSDAIFKSSGLPQFKQYAEDRDDGVNIHKYSDCVATLVNKHNL